MTGAAPVPCAADQQPDAKPVLSIIVPTYRDGARIYNNLTRLDCALSAIGAPYEIIVVSDGNVDNTREEAQRLGVSRVRVYHYAQNMGKGFALRYGAVRSHGDIVAFIDGDGDIDPSQIALYLQMMHETGADIVIGSKRHPNSEVVYPLTRRLYSTTYQTLLRILFHLRVRDTQVGLKLFRREVLLAVLPRIVVKRYAFDLELLVVAQHLGFDRIVEAPIRIGQRFSSTINQQAIVSILQETAAIYYRRNVLRYYDYDHIGVTSAFKGEPKSPTSTVDERKVVRNVAFWIASGAIQAIQRTCTALLGPKSHLQTSTDQTESGQDDQPLLA